VHASHLLTEQTVIQHNEGLAEAVVPIDFKGEVLKPALGNEGALVRDEREGPRAVGRD
jgi:hypothetical protein